MKTILLATVALIGLNCNNAQADTWPLSLVNFYANAEFNTVASTVEFYPGASLPAQQYQASGAFSLLNMSAVTMTWLPSGVDISYASLGGPSFMMFTDGTISGSFDLTLGSIVVGENTPTHVVLSGEGFITMTGFDTTLAHWAVDAVPVDAAYGWWPQVGFVVPEQSVSVPGPIVGAGIPGLLAIGLWLLALAKGARKSKAEGTI